MWKLGGGFWEGGIEAVERGVPLFSDEWNRGKKKIGKMRLGRSYMV